MATRNKPIYIDGLKQCRICKALFPPSPKFFSRCKSHSDGLKHECKGCEYKAHQKWRNDNPDKFKEQLKRYSEAHPEKAREHTTKHRERYPAIVLIRTRKWRQKNKEHVRKYNLKYRSEKSDIARAARHNRRARLRALPADFTDEDWQYAVEYFGGCCAVCKRPLNGLWHRPAADHWIPLSKGGGTTKDNIVPLCDGVDGCNQSKSNLDPTEWLAQRYGKRQANKILHEIEAYFASIT